MITAHTLSHVNNKITPHINIKKESSRREEADITESYTKGGTADKKKKEKTDKINSGSLGLVNSIQRPSEKQPIAIQHWEADGASRSRTQSHVKPYPGLSVG